MDLTCECPNCSNENAYFNGLYFECPDCDYEWSSDDSMDKEVDENEFIDDSEKLQKFYEKLDEQKVGETITLETLRELYSPSWNHEKFLLLSPPEDAEDEYFNEIEKVLIESKDFAEVLKIKPNTKLSEDKINKIRENAVKWYLDYRDDLPLTSTISDWSKYINAPESFIENIFPKNGPHVIQQLPNADSGDFTILFHRKIENLYSTLKSQKDFSEYGSFSLKEMKTIFTELAAGDFSEGYSDNIVLKGEIRNYFSTELKLIGKYRNDIRKWREGSLDHFIDEAKAQNLSKIDTIMLILNAYFNEMID